MQTIRKKGISLLVILAMLVSIVGIANTDTTYAATKKIHLKKTTVNLVVGKTYQQKLIAKNGKVIKATKVKWKSKNKSIAKINKKGKITAVKAGTAKMTAKYKGKTYKFTVKVKKKAAPAPAKTGLQKLYSYINQYGYVNGNGDKTVSYEFKTTEVFFINHSGCIEFVMYDTQDTSNYSEISHVSMMMYLPETTSTRSDIGIYMVTGQYGSYESEAHTTINCGTYTKNQTLYFYIDNDNFPSDTQNLLNATFKLAMSVWDSGLMENFGMELRDVGFKNYY